MPRPRTGVRAGPSGEERGYTALHGARLSSVPSGDQSANPASVPGRSGSPASASLSPLPHINVAELWGSPPPLRVSRAARSGRPLPVPPLQGTELAALSTPEASLERLVPLADYSAAWKLLPNVSRWGHAHCRTRLCGALPQPFYGVTPMMVGPRAGSGNGTRSEPLLREETIEVVPALDKEVRVLQPYFIVPGKGVASFLDLS